jgi:hypothetical protein
VTVVTDEKIMKINIVGVFQRYGKSWEKKLKLMAAG